MTNVSKQALKAFQNYCWEFYAPGAISGVIFDNSLTREEMDAACLIQSKTKSFEGDSFDREKARDILIAAKAR